ncbi:hypothetical protein PG993_005042 [Apiospora rasikravindrae]|uniref:Cytochrome P450 n=1 Tax=Apiospora rasikravindrae TaxID=990691 RepID=A0ABR1TH76_9PEZI
MAFEVIYHGLAFPAFLLLAALSLLRFVLYPVLFSPLAQVPKAHWSCGVSPIWILWARYTNKENRTIGEAHRRYGPIVRLAPNEVSINDMESVKTVYQGGFDKHQWYSVFNNYGVPNVFSSIYAKHHSIRKRMVSHVYSKSYLHSSAPLAAQADVILNTRVLPTLETTSHEGQAHQGIDVHSFFAAVAMDFISAYSFGLQNSPSFIQQKAYRDHWLGLYRARKGYSFFSQELPLLSRLLTLIGPYEIPGGVRISASAYNLHRDERHFPHAEIWDHTRWLHDNGMDDERQKEMNRQFWGFSSGGRMCLGSNFAMHEMKLLVAAIYTNYTSHIVDDEGIEPTDGYTSHPTSGQLWLRFERIMSL